MNSLPKDIIFYHINEILDPVSYISFIETSAFIFNKTSNSQYKRKQIEYFKSKNINVDINTIFLSLSDTLKYEISKSGDYVFIGKSTEEKIISVIGNDIGIEFNNKNIISKGEIIIGGSNITLKNGFVSGTNTTLFKLSSLCYNLIFKNLEVVLYDDSSNPDRRLDDSSNPDRRLDDSSNPDRRLDDSSNTNHNSKYACFEFELNGRNISVLNCEIFVKNL